jgi:hypothetical protein
MQSLGLSSKKDISLPKQAAPVLRGHLKIYQFGTLQQQDCFTACLTKQGYGACLARCLYDNVACDGGTTNCSPV